MEVIIGAGLAGLTAGIDLVKMGRDVTVLEKTNVLGGHAASYKSPNGYIYDIGPHVIIPDATPLYEMVKTAGIEDDLIHFEMKFGFLKNNRVYPFYPNPISIMKFKLLSIRDKIKLRMLMKEIEHLSEEDYHEVTVEEFVTEKISKKALISFFEPLFTRLSGIPPEELSAAFFIAFNKLLLQIKNFELCYPKKGMGELGVGMASYLKSIGGNVKTSYEVKQISLDEGQVTGVLYVEDGKEREIDASNVVSTVPFIDLPKIVDLPMEYANRLKRIKYTEFIIAYFGLDGKLSKYNMEVMVPRMEGFCFNSFAEVSNLTREVAPKGNSLFCVVATPCTIKGRTKEERILDAIIEDVNELFPKFEEKINWRKLIRYPFPAINKEYISLKPKFITPIKRLYLAGAQIFLLPDMTTAIVSGHTVSNIIKGTK